MIAQVTVNWQAHIEVWFLILGVLAIGTYTARVLAPKAEAAGLDPIRRSQKIWFLLATFSMWVVSDWPIHDVAEEYLYFVHMIQHLFLSMVIPAMFLLSMPRWLFELVLTPNGRIWNVLAMFSRPIVAGVIFNALTLLLHWTTIVELSFDSGVAHFLFHLMVFSSGLLMWMPVIGPVEQWRLQPLAQCVYLFMMSIVPTVPGGWLVFAETVVYRHYDTAERLWGIDALVDQQAAGLVMKLAGGFFLWGVIVVIYGRWARDEQVKNETSRRNRHRKPTPLTFEQVEQEFARTSAPTETS